MKQYENYIFDLYGTLLEIKTDESSLRFWRTMHELYARFHDTALTPQKLRKQYQQACRQGYLEACAKNDTTYGEMQLKDVFLAALEGTEFAGNEAAAYLTANFFRASSMQKCRLYEDTIPLLNRLKQEGKKIYLLSNAQTIFTIPELKKTGLDAYFDAIYISSDYGIKKPEIRFIQTLVEQHHLDIKQSVMIGNDFNSDIQSAQSIGMDAVFVNSDGYSSEQLEEMRQACQSPHTVRCIERLKEL